VKQTAASLKLYRSLLKGFQTSDAYSKTFPLSKLTQFFEESKACSSHDSAVRLADTLYEVGMIRPQSEGMWQVLEEDEEEAFGYDKAFATERLKLGGQV
jgi:hypothetical protein